MAEFYFTSFYRDNEKFLLTLIIVAMVAEMKFYESQQKRDLHNNNNFIAIKVNKLNSISLLALFGMIHAQLQLHRLQYGLFAIDYHAMISC